MNSSKATLTILTILIVGVLLGSLFGFWLTVGLLLAGKMLLSAHTYYKKGKADNESDKAADTVAS